MESILQGLNAAQHDAVTSPANVVQVLAPPGSGKTKTLTSRVAYLLQHHQYKPWNVICLTFTVKSSREMKERVAKLVGNGIASRLILGTFHSVCRRYLVTYGHLIGVKKEFGIADSSDTMSIIKRIIKRLGLTIDAKKAQSRISTSKSRGLSHARIAQQQPKDKDVEQHEFALVFGAYENQLAISNLLDYDDLLLRCVDLLRQHPTCVSNVEVVLIDEFQDTNLVQFDLMRLFAAKNKKITTVGDPDQSIYGWRSAEIKNLRRMQEEYPDTLVINLEENYRSSATILLAAHEVIQQDVSRPSKPLLPTHGPGTVPVLRRLPSSEIEATWIVSEILRVVGLSGHLLTFADFSVLLRSAALSRQVETAMGKAGIPYRMVGGQRFFDRMEIRILLDYLRVTSQLDNNDALFRIINVPARGVGTVTAKSLLEEAEAKKVTLWTHICHPSLRNSVRTKTSKAAKQGLGSLTNIIMNARSRLSNRSHPQSPEDLLRYIIKRLDFQAYLEKNYADDHETRWANVEELIAQAAEYSVLPGQDGAEEEDNDHLPSIEGLEQEKSFVGEQVAKFLANIALTAELQRDNEDGSDDRTSSRVTISTIHASKGLEWPVVFVPSTYKGCIPHSRAEDIDEERRLLYVAMTRAQVLLYMSCPTKNSQREETTLSPFLSTKKVGRCLMNQGPTIGFDVVSDVSHILRRSCPTVPQIVEASRELQNSQDDYWPLNGEDAKGPTAPRSKWDEARGDEYVPKRRRMNDREGIDCMAGTNSAYTLTTIGGATTMQSSSAFSYNGNSGFVSAASELNRARQGKAVHGNSYTFPNQPEGPSKAEHANKLQNHRRRDGNLMDLWADGKHNTRSEDKVSLEMLEEENYQKAIKASMAIETQKLASRTPLSPIPQTLAVNRLPNTRKSIRPDITTGEDQSAKTKYIFLSSSPPPVEGPSKTAEEQADENSYADALGGLRGSAAATDIKPVKLFHTTSVLQVQTVSNPRKKTLGVRRTMNGWAARTNQAFSVPRISGSQTPNQLRKIS